MLSFYFAMLKKSATRIKSPFSLSVVLGQKQNTTFSDARIGKFSLLFRECIFSPSARACCVREAR
jgi:hypothetical protein